MVTFVKFKGSCYVGVNDKKTVRKGIIKAINEKFNSDSGGLHCIDADLTEIKIKDFYCIDE